MQEAISPNSLRGNEKELPQTTLHSSLNSTSTFHENFELPFDYHPSKWPKDISDRNQIVANILRQAILKEQYPFYEEEINAVLKSLNHETSSDLDVRTSQTQSKNDSDCDISKKTNIEDRNLFIDENTPHDFSFDSSITDNFKFDEPIEIHKGEIVCGFNGKMPAHLRKYWAQRNRLFSRYDEGILIDEEGWFSVTPELVARQIAKRMACDVIVDAFCGIGGNSIQFAYTCGHVIAIDNNATRIAFAKHNAKIYGVDHKIEFILGDFFELASSLKADAIFLSPPWGGPAYNKVPRFDIHTMMPFSGVKLFKLCSAITPNIGFFLPRNTDYNQLACLATPIGNCEIEEEYSSLKFIAITAYYGNIVSS